MRSGQGQLMLFDDLCACRRCGRMLSRPDSLRRHYGWICWLRKVQPKFCRRWKRSEP